MSILSMDDYIASNKQVITYDKTGAVVTLGAMPYTLFAAAGYPGAGTFNIGNTANGLVPEDTTTGGGYPTINAFASGAIGYLTRVAYGCSVASRIQLYDRLFAAGAYSFNSDVTLTNQPSIAARVPGSDYRGLEIWIEAVTAFTGALSVRVYYTDELGNSRDSGVIVTAALTINRMFMIPLAAGDKGVQRIDRVVGSVASGGTFNVMILRPLWTGRVPSLSGGETHDLLSTGMPRIYEHSALFVIEFADSTANGILDMSIEIANK